MNWLYFTRSNGDVDSMPNNTTLTTIAKKRAFIGDDGATNFQAITTEDAPKNAKWDGDKYISAPINEKARINALESQCYAYQCSMDGFRCPANFYSVLVGAKAAGKLGAKGIACLVALRDLWSIYEIGKADSSVDALDLSGVIPHSFDEIDKEIEAV